MFFAALVCCNALFAQDEVTILQGFDMNGCSKKLFSVSATKKVHFSRGNLQYNAAQDKWRFAPRQYEYCCEKNLNASSSYNDWIDLFGWGTSGWDGSGATAYQPWSRSASSADYLPGGDGTISLIGSYANADWGVYNKISNGGNGKGMWRTLTSDEWQYLLNKGSFANSTRANKYGFAKLQGLYEGMVILPDDWTLPTGLSFTPGRDPNFGFDINKYTINEWQRMEAAGAVFLPCAGKIWGSNYMKPASNGGAYWSVTPQDGNSTTRAGYLNFTKNPTYGVSWGVDGMNRYSGNSVRLVRDSRESHGEAFDENGASYKEFSVSATSTVRFSKGNLQYNAAQNIWRFAAKQYQYIGNPNTNISSSYNGWIDLFGWGTSGWNSGATAYQPWSTSETDADYYPGGSDTVSLTGDYANADWGHFNRINNGGNKAGKWRTLTNNEWEYLLGENATRSGKCGLSTIRTASKSYTGLVILPDDWTLPSGLTFTSGYGNEFNTNVYTADQWQQMESAGALFLPAAGSRNGTFVNFVGTLGRYWSSSYLDSSAAYLVHFSVAGIFLSSYDFRYTGFPVRLVRD